MAQIFAFKQHHARRRERELMAALDDWHTVRDWLEANCAFFW